MLLTLLYHRINNEKFGIDPKSLENHLKYFKKHFNIIFPGEKIIPYKINLCLTFDDAYFDFFKFAYPLLLKYKIKATLAIPVKYILDETDINDDIRLNTSYKE